MLIAVFGTTYSLSVQDSMYRMGEAVLAAIPEIAEISFAMPNKHYIPINLEAVRPGEPRHGVPAHGRAARTDPWRRSGGAEPRVCETNPRPVVMVRFCNLCDLSEGVCDAAPPVHASRNEAAPGKLGAVGWTVRLSNRQQAAV